MLSGIGCIVSSPYFYIPVISAVVVGITAKVSKVAFPIIKKVAHYVYDINCFVSFRALFCKKCSNLHRYHFNPTDKDGNIPNN